MENGYLTINNMLYNVIPIVTCVDMSDFLSVSLKENRELFKEYAVLTSPEDTKTKELCSKYDARVIEFNKFKDSKFNKAGGVRHAQNIIHKEHVHKWILLMDADIVLQKNFVEVIKETRPSKFITPKTSNKVDFFRRSLSVREKINSSAIYGIDRYDILNMKELFVTPTERKYPIKHAGYFQLYFDKSKYYPSHSQDASNCDLEFKNLFGHKKMIKSYVFHLGGERTSLAR